MLSLGEKGLLYFSEPCMWTLAQRQRLMVRGSSALCGCFEVNLLLPSLFILFCYFIILFFRALTFVGFFFFQNLRFGFAKTIAHIIFKILLCFDWLKIL